MFGDDATRILRQQGFAAPILGVTGDALSADLQLFKEAGASEVSSQAPSRSLRACRATHVGAGEACQTGNSCECFGPIWIVSLVNKSGSTFQYGHAHEHVPRKENVNPKRRPPHSPTKVVGTARQADRFNACLQHVVRNEPCVKLTANCGRVAPLPRC